MNRAAVSGILFQSLRVLLEDCFEIEALKHQSLVNWLLVFQECPLGHPVGPGGEGVYTKGGSLECKFALKETGILIGLVESKVLLRKPGCPGVGATHKSVLKHNERALLEPLKEISYFTMRRTPLRRQLASNPGLFMPLQRPYPPARTKIAQQRGTRG